MVFIHLFELRVFHWFDDPHGQMSPYSSGAYTVSIEIVEAVVLLDWNEVHRWSAEPQISAVNLNLPDFLAFCRHKVDEARASGASLFHTVLHLNIATLLCFSVIQPGEVHCLTRRATLAQGRRPSQVTQLLLALPVSANGPPLHDLIGCGTEDVLCNWSVFLSVKMS